MGGLEEILNKDNTVVVIVDSMFVNHLRLETLKKSPLVKMLWPFCGHTLCAILFKGDFHP